MNRSIVYLLLIAAFSLSFLAPAQAQDAPTTQPERNNGLNVFLDCHTRCHRDHFRREISFVNWVRDRQDADVHILVTAQRTGAGREYIFNFIGLQEFAGHSDTLRYVSSNTDVRDEQRDGQTRTLQMGLMRFVANTPVANHITISYNAPGGEDVRAQPEDDPWNYWVFSVGASGSFRSESLQRNYSVRGNVSASRTTENWRMYFSGRGNYRESRYEFDAGEISVYTTDEFGFRGYVIRSLGDHWGTGVRSSVGKSIRYNQDIYARFASGLEYSVFPYAESTRRSFTFLYTVGVVAFDYEKITVFSHERETRLEQTLEIALGVVQPWGDMRADLESSTYLHDLSLHEVEFGIGMSIRLVRGLNFHWGGSAARIQNQIYLSGEGIPADEILLHRRALGTDFRMNASFGLSYTFGSIFNNVVNPRMDDFR